MPEDDSYIEEAEPYDETILSADTGTLTFRDYGEGNVWLGLREGNEPRSLPQVTVRLTDRQMRMLCNLLLDVRKLLR